MPLSLLIRAKYSIALINCSSVRGGVFISPPLTEASVSKDLKSPFLLSTRKCLFNLSLATAERAFGISNSIPKYLPTRFSLWGSYPLWGVYGGLKTHSRGSTPSGGGRILTSSSILSLSSRDFNIPALKEAMCLHTPPLFVKSGQVHLNCPCSYLTS